VRNDGRRVCFTITRAQPLSGWVADHAHYFTGWDVGAWLEAGCFHCGGEVAGGETELAEGSVLTLQQPPWDEPDLEEPIALVHREPSLWIVDKPAGIPTTPTGRFYRSSLVHHLRELYGVESLSPLHRLDIETSGLVAFAVGVEQRDFYQRQFRERRVVKEYAALVNGRVDPGLERIALALGRHPRIHSRFIADPEGKPGVTEIVSVRHLEGFSELIVRPREGRTNQIRAHLAAIGHAIVGDKKYAEDEAIYLDWVSHRDVDRLIDRLRLPRQALCCVALTLETPGGRRRFTSRREPFLRWREGLGL